jgi:hypothetical protein
MYPEAHATIEYKAHTKCLTTSHFLHQNLQQFGYIINSEPLGYLQIFESNSHPLEEQYARARLHVQGSANLGTGRVVKWR